jgi:hypothetical protein
MSRQSGSGSRIGLVLLLVSTAAALAMPPLADAAPAPHWLANNVKIEEGRQLPFIAWGQLGFGEASRGLPIECSNDVAGYLENPPGGGPGIEVTQGWTAYNCVFEECEGEGGQYGLLFENENGPGADVALNWPGELTEVKAGTIRLNSTNVRMYYHCQFAALAATERAGTGQFEGLEERESKEYKLYGNGGTCTTASPGALEPKLKSGTNAEKPSKLEFGPGSGEQECGETGRAIVSRALKIIGYPESELIAAANR